MKIQKEKPREQPIYIVCNVKRRSSQSSSQLRRQQKEIYGEERAKQKNGWLGLCSSKFATI